MSPRSVSSAAVGSSARTAAARSRARGRSRPVAARRRTGSRAASPRGARSRGSRAALRAPARGVAAARAVQLHHQRDVLLRGEERDQVVLLEDEADVAAAERAHVDAGPAVVVDLTPFITMRPAVGSRIRLIASSSVLLPEPLGPSRRAVRRARTRTRRLERLHRELAAAEGLGDACRPRGAATSASERELRRRAQGVPDRHQAGDAHRLPSITAKVDRGLAGQEVQRARESRRDQPRAARRRRRSWPA